MSEITNLAHALASADHKSGFCSDYEALARGALVAMRNPSKKMLKAAARAMSPDKRPSPERVSVREKHRIRYQAMIDAALDETDE